MLIVTRGNLKSTSGSHGLGGDYNCCYLTTGDICGELLFCGSRLPTSERSVMTLTQVEGFTLLPDDFKFVVSHLNQLQIRKLKRTLRYNIHINGDHGLLSSYRRHGEDIAKGSVLTS
ncbi:putative cyclic nucleotide-gated ion channel 12 [Cardamine amara subsp. amara]